MCRTFERATSSTLAQRLEAVLRGGAAAIGCSAAGAYLLDHDTTHLKLRASWGLPPGRLADDARPLDEAPADLEALCGHVVVMENQDIVQQWRCPEPDFAAAVCVPISSPQALLGTLWLLADEPRNFTDRETDLAEIIAGRIASDLQCEALLEAAICAADLRRQLISAEQSQQNSLPQIAPLSDGWEVAADSWQGGPLGGAFHDWFVLDDNTLAIVAGRATGHRRGPPGVERATVPRPFWPFSASSKCRASRTVGVGVGNTSRSITTPKIRSPGLTRPWVWASEPGSTSPTRGRPCSSAVILTPNRRQKPMPHLLRTIGSSISHSDLAYPDFLSD
ncbi:MAG: GAF domain-containing protein [Planctomycetes bacterium]|nr:GAF domain-containing protein [Planctomycetota bacterium]